MLRVAIGFRAHSGWAAAVAILDGKPVERRRIELCDCLVLGSAQPYHAAAEMPVGKAAAYLKRCAELSAATAERELQKLIGDLSRKGYRVGGCAILLGSGRPAGELAKTLASHAMIHTAEGDFYRDAIREACRRCGVAVRGVKERDLCSRVGEVKGLGKELGPPWRADQKLCTLAALSIVQV